MLRRDLRLRKDEDIQKVVKKGISQYDDLCGFRFIDNSSESSRVTVIIGKKVHKRAVVRNKLKRQYRDIIRRLLPNFKKNVDIVFFPTKNAIEVSFQDKEERLIKVLTKKGLL